MKKFKELLAETGPIPGGGQQATFGRYAVGYSPAVLSKINAIIGSYVTEDQIDPYGVLYRIRGSLNNLGLTFDQIAEWLNKEGYLSVRGKKFKGNHVHSIVKKKRMKDEKFEKEYPEVRSDFNLDIYDKTLVNTF